jgi:diaminohydroxyphosphoribosylaminopyrimidine deaminase/5-amino-6-(5-phosphoribosylamino)uracil reductase
VSTGLPWVTLKEATSLDGRIALASGASRFITGAAARRVAMALRLASDAVLVGIETVLADDPQLTARRGSRVAKPLVRAVLDSRLRTPPRARLLEAGRAGRVWVYAAPDAPAARRRALERRGASVVNIPAPGGKLDMTAVLKHLGGLGVGRLLVEGGGKVAATLVSQGLADRVVYHVAPRLLGGDARAAVGALGLERLTEAPELVQVEVERAGRDLIVSGMLSRPGRHSL